MNDLQVGDRVQFINMITGEKMEGKLVSGGSRYLMVHVEGKKAVFVARVSETTKVEEVK